MVTTSSARHPARAAPCRTAHDSSRHVRDVPEPLADERFDAVVDVGERALSAVPPTTLRAADVGRRVRRPGGNRDHTGGAGDSRRHALGRAEVAPSVVAPTHAGLAAHDSTSAREAGLRPRPLDETVRAALKTERGPDLAREREAGLAPGDESDILRSVDGRAAGTVSEWR